MKELEKKLLGRSALCIKVFSDQLLIRVGVFLVVTRKNHACPSKFCICVSDQLTDKIYANKDFYNFEIRVTFEISESKHVFLFLLLSLYS